jgi:glycosyltransferase involved in cell wall biosynthesis
MANQCEQLLRLIRKEGVHAELVRTNEGYRPAWIVKVPILRAVFRLLPYFLALWRAAGRADVFHVFANSGWSWYLYAAPALWIGRARGVPVIVNYRGGLADEFFSRSRGRVLAQLADAAMRVTPSVFLQRIFEQHGFAVRVIPNIIDLERFQPSARVLNLTAPSVLVARNLEPIYGIPTALEAFAKLLEQFPAARLTVAGSGHQLSELERLAAGLGIAHAVQFVGRIENARINDLYAGADLVLNPSTADNMPISILEALACGVPVVSTNAGGIPDLVQHGHTALLVDVGDASAMAAAAARVLTEPPLREGLRTAGLEHVRRFAWVQVRQQWRQAYLDAAKVKA